MHARDMNSPSSAAVEAEEGNLISVSSTKSKDRMSEDRKKTLGKLATHDVLKTTHLTKTAPILPFLYRATVFCQTANIIPVRGRGHPGKHPGGHRRQW